MRWLSGWAREAGDVDLAERVNRLCSLSSNAVASEQRLCQGGCRPWRRSGSPLSSVGSLNEHGELGGSRARSPSRFQPEKRCSLDEPLDAGQAHRKTLTGPFGATRRTLSKSLNTGVAAGTTAISPCEICIEECGSCAMNASMTEAGMPGTIGTWYWPVTKAHPADRVESMAREGVDLVEVGRLRVHERRAVAGHTAEGLATGRILRHAEDVEPCLRPRVKGRRGKQPVLDGVSAAWVRSSKGRGSRPQQGSGSSGLHSRPAQRSEQSAHPSRRLGLWNPVRRSDPGDRRFVLSKCSNRRLLADYGARS